MKVSVFLSKKVYKNGASPIMVRMSHKYKQQTKVIAAIPPDHWHERTRSVKSVNKNHKEINRQIRSWIDKGEQYIASGRNPNSFFHDTGNTLTDILYRLKQRYDNEGRIRSAKKVDTTIDKVSRFGDAHINDINRQWVDGFNSFLLASDGNKDNTRKKYLKVINQVVKDEFYKGNITTNPFHNYKMPSNESIKVKLTQKEVSLLEAYDGPYQLEKDLFLFAFYCRGIRVSDVLTLTRDNVISGRLIYTAAKTGKHCSIELIDKAMRIIDKYIGSPYLFPVLTKIVKSKNVQLRSIDKANSLIRKRLNLISAGVGIEKRIGMHTARHTFAYLADKAGLSVHEISQLLNHSSIAVTENYLRTLRKDDQLDRAASKVFKN